MRSLLFRIAFRTLMASMDRNLALRTLGLPEEASVDDIKVSYRKLMLQYHPDKHSQAPVEDQQVVLEKIKMINLAREALEASPQNPNRPLQDDSRGYARDESWWDSFRAKYGPKPSKHYTDSDIRTFVDQVFDGGYLQYIDRHLVPYWPGDMWFDKAKERWSRPVGPKRATKRQKPENKQTILEGLLRHPGTIFDIAVTPREAWITWELNRGREFHSVSFEPVKVVQKKDPNVGMKPMAVMEYLASKGLHVVAGGTKYSYYSFPGMPKRDGVYIRLGTGNMVVVVRGKIDSDIKITKEFYYGQVTPQILDAMIIRMKKRIQSEASAGS